jgi:hypothetical protein
VVTLNYLEKDMKQIHIREMEGDEMKMVRSLYKR